MKNTILIESITYDLQYFFTNKGIVKISLDENENINPIEYNLNNFTLGLEILKENLQTKFDLGLINQNEYVFSARKFLYESLDVFRPSNQFSIITEWENKFGKNVLLIKESFDTTELRKIFNNSWNGLCELYSKKIINPIIEEQNMLSSLWSGAKSFVSWGWDNIKKTISKAFTCAKGSSYIECFMEGLRTIATSFLGVAVLTGVSFIPAVGQIPNLVIFGALLIYDIWKMMTGKKYSVADIVVDIVSLLAPAIASRIGGAVKGLTSFWGLGKIAGSGVLGTFIQSLSKGIGNLATIIGKTVGYFASKLGIKWLGDMAKSANAGLSKITSDISAGQKSAGKEGAKSEKSKTTDVKVPKEWEKFPCVGQSKNVKQLKASDGTIVYEGGGYIWFNDGRKINPKTNEVSTFSCSPDGKVVGGSVIKLTDDESIDTQTFKNCSDFPFTLGCKNDKIKRVQVCLNTEPNGNFTKNLQDILKEKGYGDILTEPIYDKIMKDCKAAEEDAPLSSGGFAKDV
jgi:hypothetical protein